MHNTAEQIPFTLPHRAAHGREDFMIGPSNASAVDWIDRWPNWPTPFLIVNGPAASGKTHLAAVWREQSAAQTVKPDMLAEHSADHIAVLGDHLLIDNVDPWLGTREAEETLFHLYNMFKEEKRSILLTTRAAAAHIHFVIADLASRMRGAPCATIMSPDDTLLRNIIIKLFGDRQLSIGDDVLKYLIPRMERSFVAARDIVSKSDSLALSQKRSISIPVIRDVLIAMQDSDSNLGA